MKETEHVIVYWISAPIEWMKISRKPIRRCGEDDEIGRVSLPAGTTRFFYDADAYENTGRRPVTAKPGPRDELRLNVWEEI